MSVDKQVIDFGTSVIGETLARTFTLTNKGALPTKFDFYKITGVARRIHLYTLLFDIVFRYNHT